MPGFVGTQVNQWLEELNQTPKASSGPVTGGSVEISASTGEAPQEDQQAATNNEEERKGD